MNSGVPAAVYPSVFNRFQIRQTTLDPVARNYPIRDLPRGGPLGEDGAGQPWVFRVRFPGGSKNNGK